MSPATVPSQPGHHSTPTSCRGRPTGCMRELSCPLHSVLTPPEQARTMARRRTVTAPPTTTPGGWNLDHGEEIVPGRTAVGLLGSSRVHDVYAAWDEAILGVVAVKMLQPGSVGDDAARRALAAEAAALRALSHPSFPRCFDEVVDGDRPHIVLELVEGPRLSTLIRRQRRLGVEQAIPLVLQIASADPLPLDYRRCPPRREAQERPHGPSPEVDRPERRSFDRGREGHPSTPSVPTVTWHRNSAARVSRTRSVMPPTCGGSASPSTSPSRGAAPTPTATPPRAVRLGSRNSWTNRRVCPAMCPNPSRR